jgi:hypothetical protein
MIMINGRRMVTIINTKDATGMTKDHMGIRASTRDNEDLMIMEVKDLASLSLSTKMTAPHGRKAQHQTAKSSTPRTRETITIKAGTIRTKTTNIIGGEDHRIASLTLAILTDHSGRTKEVLTTASKIDS